MAGQNHKLEGRSTSVSSVFSCSILNSYGLAVLAGYWFVVIRHLHVEWIVNPQYSYGWAVPLLCAFLFFKRWPARPQAVGAPASRWPLFWTALLALMFFPTCLAEAANPEWRVASWLFSIEAIGLSLCALWLFKGWPWVCHFWFPLAFFLVAVPWLRPIEMPLIGALTRGITAATVEVLGVVGIPAIQHGNVIEVASGVVGIDEACSGIRCFQATLMISLFFGEFYGLIVLRRTALCLLGFALSFLFNLVRTTLLATVAAEKGIAAVASWHDPAGVTILVGCFLCLWLIAKSMRKAETLKTDTLESLAQKAGMGAAGRPGYEATAVGAQVPTAGVQGSRLDVGCSMLDFSPIPPLSPDPRLKFGAQAFKCDVPPADSLSSDGDGQDKGSHPAIVPNSSLSAFQYFSICLGAWLLIAEGATEAWYRSHSRPPNGAPSWSVSWPTGNSSFRELPMPEKVVAFLRFDEGHSVVWQEMDSSGWQMFYFRWLPGRVSDQLVGDHNPSICLPASGRELLSVSETELISVHGLQFRFRCYQFIENKHPVYVFYTVWEAGAPEQLLPPQHVTARDRLRAVMSGRRNPGQRVLEIAIWGMASQPEAEAALQRQLKTLIRTTSAQTTRAESRNSPKDHGPF